MTLSKKNKVVFVLPGSADPESLTVSLSSGKIRIEDISFKSVERVDENKIARLKTQIKKMQSEKKELQAKIQAIDTQLLFWQAQTKTKTKTVSDADQFSAAIGRNVRKLQSDKNNIESDASQLDKQIKGLEDSLNQITGKKESAWETTVLLAGAEQKDVTISYSYILTGCGWNPVYRLEADIPSRSVHFYWNAEIWQSTGSDWDDVQTHLATASLPKSLTPPDLPLWIIKPKTPILYKPAGRTKAMKKAELQAQTMEEATSAPPAIETAHTTYSVWSVGRKSIVAGSRQQIKIREELWPAEFIFLARPGISPEAFLQARIKLPQAMDVPAGQTIFAVDGSVIGKRNFSLSGSEAEIFFGNSPFVNVYSTMTLDKTGGTKLFQNKQTRQWHWIMEAKNSGRAPVTLRIEDSIPQARDERIKLNFKHMPQPNEKDEFKWVWMVDVPAGQKKNIETTVLLEAPGDMVLDFGLRR